MVTLDVVAPQLDVKMKGHDKSQGSQKGKTDRMSFGDVIGNTLNQANAETCATVCDGVQISAFFDVQETDHLAGICESDVISESLKSTVSEENVENSVNNELSTSYDTWFSFNGPRSLGGMTTVDETASFDESSSFDDRIFGGSKVLSETAFKKEPGYTPTWRMRDDGLKVLDNKRDLANTIVLDDENLSGDRVDKGFKGDEAWDRISVYMKELGGQIRETSNRPEIALTAEFLTESPVKSNDDPDSLAGSKVLALFPNGEPKMITLSSSQVAPLTPALNPATQVAQNIHQAALHLAPRGVHEMTVSLHPAELGKLDVSLRMENGQLHVVIKASELGTGQFLQNQMQDLRQNLSDAGINCGDLQMDFGDQAQEQSFEETCHNNPNFFAEENDEAGFNSGLPENGIANDSSSRINIKA
ncbi:MAG: flagellar hook-length control protein FliK [Peptococcaceae bacterium]|nr:flagellar hook-length control protein FliK [Peptococcaceae bacterium]